MKRKNLNFIVKHLNLHNCIESLFLYTGQTLKRHQIFTCIFADIKTDSQWTVTLAVAVAGVSTPLLAVH